MEEMETKDINDIIDTSTEPVDIYSSLYIKKAKQESKKNLIKHINQ